MHPLSSFFRRVSSLSSCGDKKEVNCGPHCLLAQKHRRSVPARALSLLDDLLNPDGGELHRLLLSELHGGEARCAPNEPVFLVGEGIAEKASNLCVDRCWMRKSDEKEVEEWTMKKKIKLSEVNA